MVSAGLHQDHPAAGIRPPREKKAAEDFGYLSKVEPALLFRSAPLSQKEGPLHDRAILALFGLRPCNVDLSAPMLHLINLKRRPLAWQTLH